MPRPLYTSTADRPWMSAMSLFAVSLVLHGSALFSVNHALVTTDKKLVEEARMAKKDKAESVTFEFVEAPPKISPQEPVKSKKISDRDSLNQDLTKKMSSPSVLPNIAAEGPSDQLAQTRGALPKPASPKIDPVKEVPQQEDTDTQKDQEKVIKEASITQEVSPDLKKLETIMKPQEEKPLSQPKAPVPTLTGEDKITTQEASRFKSTGAKLFGQTSFEATGSGMGEYMKNLKEKIWLAWFPYLVFQYPRDFRGADAVISFTLNAQGEVKILHVVESHGTPLFASFCMEAIQRAGNFGKVPDEILALIGKDELEIRFGFHYR